MKRRIIRVLLFTVCAMLLLTSCGAKGLLDAYYVEPETEKALTASTKIESVSGTVASAVGELILFKDIQLDKTVYKVYNAKTESVVFNQQVLFTDAFELSITLGSIDGVSYFVVKQLNDSATKVSSAKLYTAGGGTPLAESATDPEYSEYNDEVIIFNRVAYKVNESGKIYKAFDVDEFSVLGNSDYSTDEYNYFFTDEKITVTDKKGAFIGGLAIESYAEDHIAFVLENGDVVVQYLVKLPDDTKKYDVFTKNSEDVSIDDFELSIPTDCKMDLVTKIFDVSSGETEDIDLDFIIFSLTNRTVSGSGYFYDSYKRNIARIVKINDYRIDENCVELVSLSNSLSVKNELSDIVEGAVGVRYAGNEMFCVYDRFSNVSFVSPNGKIIKTVPSSTLRSITVDRVITDDSVYDHEFKKLYDLKANNYKLVDIADDHLILSRETVNGVEYARYSQGTVNIIITADAVGNAYVGSDESGIYGLYCIMTTAADETVSYNYYNGAGALVGTYPTLIDLVLSTEDGIMIVKDFLGNYYRVQ